MTSSELRSLRVVIEQWASWQVEALSGRGSDVRGLSVLLDGASEEEIADAETRLDTALPADYRAFLRISNGARVGTFLPTDDEVHRESGAVAGFMAVTDIGWARDIDMKFLTDWECPTRAGARAEPYDGDGMVEVTDHAPLWESLLITYPADNERDYLVPDKKGNWQLWAMGRYGATAWPSFVGYLRWQVGRPKY